MSTVEQCCSNNRLNEPKHLTQRQGHAWQTMQTKREMETNCWEGERIGSDMKSCHWFSISAIVLGLEVELRLLRALLWDTVFLSLGAPRPAAALSKDRNRVTLSALLAGLGDGRGVGRDTSYSQYVSSSSPSRKSSSPSERMLSLSTEPSSWLPRAPYDDILSFQNDLQFRFWCHERDEAIEKHHKKVSILHPLWRLGPVPQCCFFLASHRRIFVGYMMCIHILSDTALFR